MGDGFNFVGIRHHPLRVVQHSIDPDEFPPGVGTGIKLELLLKRGRRQYQSKLFLNLPASGRIVAFTGIQMSRGTGIIAAGKTDLGHGALLNNQGTRLVKNQDMDCPVKQLAGMRFAPCRLANDSILRINDIKYFHR